MEFVYPVGRGGPPIEYRIYSGPGSALPDQCFPITLVRQREVVLSNYVNDYPGYHASGLRKGPFSVTLYHRSRGMADCFGFQKVNTKQGVDELLTSTFTQEQKARTHVVICRIAQHYDE